MNCINLNFRDSVVPIHFAKHSYEKLTKQGVKMEYIEDPYQDHEVTDDELKRLVEFFEKTFQSNKPPSL